MKRKINLTFILFLILTLSLSIIATGCGKKKDKKNSDGSDSFETVTVSADSPSKTVAGMSADEVIKQAESASYKSGDADSDNLYVQNEIPFDSDNVFIQSHLESEFEVYEMDSVFFVPVGTDYFIGNFEKGKTLLYSYDYFGDAADVKMRIVYESKEKLLEENKNLSLTEDKMNSEGLTYHDNVLYKRLDEAGLFQVGSSINKYTLLKKASAGAFDKSGYLYYFSKPYAEDSYSEGKYADVDNFEYYIPEDEDDDLYEIPELTERTIYEIFTGLMENKDVSLAAYSSRFRSDVSSDTIKSLYEREYPRTYDYEICDIRLVAQKEDVAYAEIIMYTVPKDYKVGDKIDNYMLGGVIAVDKDTNTWKFAHCDSTWDYIKDDYYYNALTAEAYDALAAGSLCSRMWIPFNLSDPFLYQDALSGRVMEAYIDAYGDFYVTICFANGTDDTVVLGSITNLALMCESGVLFEVSCDLGETISPDQVLYERLYIPAEYMNFLSFSSVSVGELAFTTR